MMKKILIVETVDRLMPMFIKLTNEYFGSCNIYVLHISKNSFEIEEYNSKLIISKGKLSLLSDELFKIGIEFVCLDNYISFNNLRVVKNIKNFKKIIISIGLYINPDKIAYAFIRFGSTNSFFVSLESIFFKIKYNIFLLKLLCLDSAEDFFYRDATVLFWNRFSENNFKRDYPKVKTDNIFLFEKAKEKLNNNYISKDVFRVIFTPSILGSQNTKKTIAEFTYWANLAKVISFANPEFHFAISIHPTYSNKLHLFEGLNKKLKVFDEIFCGFNVENNNYHLLITDMSTLFWIAPLYGLRSEIVENFFLDKKIIGYNGIY
ncbi:hypothetical protein [Flavobacterium sp.]|uniref:hypothetical protein n=1 Tax=Flavobacterium sp. TaxID=239 RepID=UPI00286F8A8A|nr:hypothetical protein [Flavobacterium sp.]